MGKNQVMDRKLTENKMKKIYSMVYFPPTEEEPRADPHGVQSMHFV
jgi:hypothetical protein